MARVLANTGRLYEAKYREPRAKPIEFLKKKVLSGKCFSIIAMPYKLSYIRVCVFTKTITFAYMHLTVIRVCNAK